MKCGQVFDVLETGFHEVMYGNVAASAIPSLTEWPVLFYDIYNKKRGGGREIIKNIVFRYDRQNDGVKTVTMPLQEN